MRRLVSAFGVGFASVAVFFLSLLVGGFSLWLGWAARLCCLRLACWRGVSVLGGGCGFPFRLAGFF